MDSHSSPTPHHTANQLLFMSSYSSPTPHHTISQSDLTTQAPLLSHTVNQPLCLSSYSSPTPHHTAARYPSPHSFATQPTNYSSWVPICTPPLTTQSANQISLLKPHPFVTHPTNYPSPHCQPIRSHYSSATPLQHIQPTTLLEFLFKPYPSPHCQSIRSHYSIPTPLPHIQPTTLLEFLFKPYPSPHSQPVNQTSWFPCSWKEYILLNILSEILLSYSPHQQWVIE